MRSFLPGALALGFLAAASPALASAEYPEAIRDHLALDYIPPCALCHLDGQTGAGTVNTLFGRAMRDRGLTGGTNLSALSDALDKLEADGVDSDGDGVSDIDELRAGTDPNSSGTLQGGPEPGFGCFASIASSGPESPSGGVMLAAGGLLLLSLLRGRGRGRSTGNPGPGGGVV